MFNRRRCANWTRQPGLEPLEQRTLLSTLTPLPAIPVTPVKLPVGFELTKTVVPNDFAGKLDARLWESVEPVLLQHARQPTAPARVNSNGAIQVQIKTTGPLQSAITSLRRLGIRAQTTHAKLGIVQAWVNPNQLQAITAIGAVRSVGLPLYARSSAGSVQTEGDTLLFADQLRARFAHLGIDGTGIKIGVISDGVDHRAQVGDNLPGITINPSLPGAGDEGTAMLEIIHDLAPGAQLYFSGPNTNLDMIDSINWLASQGCDIIVDDLLFPGEPYFSDGPIAQAAQAVVNAGVTYISAAGNQGVAAGFFGDSHYQGYFNNDGVGFHDFDPGPSIDVFKELLVANGASLTVVLQWSDPFGGSGNDFDVYLMGSAFQVITASTGSQAAFDDPIEAFTWTNDTGADQLVRLLINWFGGNPSRELEMFTFGAGTGAFDNNVQTDSIVGHQAAPGVIAVSAINSMDPGADTIEFFASRGRSTIYTNFDTQTSILRQTLDGAAIDAVQTRVGQLGYFINPFFGTSAAAPHVAAIAAMMLQSNPSLSPAEVTTKLRATADDLSEYGIGYDDISGAGRFNALRAVFSSIVLSAPDLSPFTDSGVSSSDNITNASNLTLTGVAPAGAFVQLYIDGLMDHSVQLTPGETVYTLTTIAPGLFDGTHHITVRVAPSSTTPLDERSPNSQGLAVVIDTTPVSPPLVEFLFDTSQRLRFTFNEIVSTTFTASDLLVENLTLGGNALFLLGHVGNTALASFMGILPNGNYRATIAGGSITDIAGNPMTADVAYNFYVLAGDANRDRRVDLQDLMILAANWGQPGKTFLEGNFNYTGTVDAADLGILSMNWQTTLADPPPAASAITTAAKSASRAAARTPTRLVGLVV